ncbi:MAG: hypothetical protein BWY71_00261 [Planctomycetes bacterium ADurb.Bin412]|nr:MAG: hypothetical protein BWY71_00261 [Planctomycetes bacterium ADurb.Bin412]
MLLTLLLHLPINLFFLDKWNQIPAQIQYFQCSLMLAYSLIGTGQTNIMRNLVRYSFFQDMGQMWLCVFRFQFLNINLRQILPCFLVRRIKLLNFQKSLFRFLQKTQRHLQLPDSRIHLRMIRKTCFYLLRQFKKILPLPIYQMFRQCRFGQFGIRRVGMVFFHRFLNILALYLLPFTRAQSIMTLAMGTFINHPPFFQRKNRDKTKDNIHRRVIRPQLSRLAAEPTNPIIRFQILLTIIPCPTTIYNMRHIYNPLLDIQKDPLLRTKTL